MSPGSVRSLLILCSSVCLALFGCSIVRDLSVDQCKTDGDCRKFGDYSCSEENVCVANMTNTSGASSGGTKADGGTESSGGTAGAPVMAECTKNKDCIDAHDGEPYICRDEACVPLTDADNCPYVVAGTEENPTEYLTKPGKPIIFGAYVPIDAANPEGHPYTLIYKFALKEFMQATLGGVNGRPFVMVLCQSTEPDLEASVGHLVDTVGVPAILASLPSADLATVLNLVKDRPKPVFLLGPFEADSSLISLDEGNRLWHMLGPVTDLVPTYAPLFELAESYVHRVIKKDDPGTPLKVAVINTDLTYSLDLAAVLPGKVSINGHPLNADENEGYYERVQVPVVGKDPVDTSDVKGRVESADIIVSLGGKEFIDPVLKEIQASRTTNNSPFYILSPRNTFDANLSLPSYYVGESGTMGMTFVDKVMAGVNYASVEDSKLYDKYLMDIQVEYPGQKGLESRENFYDAAYFMLYSLAAASQTSTTAREFDGDNVVDGMRALISGSRDATVGLGENGDMINYVLGLLDNGVNVRLEGTLGPPNFDARTGARNSPGSVWCVSKPGQTPTVKYDMLRLDPEMPTQLKLSEASFCYPNFFPIP
ncbi:MAG: hypothetical protein EOO73_07600 [Myxococcales bacterium]|nr:MAG: hypothetical protein EOO73_07600 [Myxococcales bacterium]